VLWISLFLILVVLLRQYRAPISSMLFDPTWYQRTTTYRTTR
jgi:hypothetical protein